MAILLMIDSFRKSVQMINYHDIKMTKKNKIIQNILAILMLKAKAHDTR